MNLTKKRIMAMFLGYRAKNPKYGFSIEKKAGKHKKLNLVLHHAEYAEFCNTPNTWITPGVPYMLIYYSRIYCAATLWRCNFQLFRKNLKIIPVDVWSVLCEQTQDDMNSLIKNNCKIAVII